MILPGFCGGTYQPRSANVDAERCINLYPVVAEAGTPKVKTWLVGTPGLKGFVNFTVNIGGPVRALWQMNGRAFAVVGQGFYEFFAAHRGKRWGSMAVDGNPATICSNGTAGNQIFIVSAGHGYIFRTDTNTFTEITDPNFPSPCAMGAFVDGYFVGLLRDSRQFRISELEDGMTWGTVLDNTAETSTSADNFRAMASIHRQLWLFGEQSAHVWQNVGSTSVYYQGVSFPFAPIPGVYIEHGIHAPYSVVSLDNTLFWLGANKLGVGEVWRANGYTPQRISTDAVEYWMSKRTRLNRAVGYAYQEEGHSFYVLHVPDSHSREDETTWVYDVATGWWHERATWNEDTYRFEPHEGQCHCYAFGRHFIGSHRTGQIYEQSLDLYDEDVTLLESTVDEPDVPDVDPGTPVVPDVNRDLWFGYFYSASTRYGYNTDGIPQNCLYIEDNASVAYAVANSLPFVVKPDAFGDAEAQAALVIALYCEGGSPEALAVAASDLIAARPAGLVGKPVIGVCDGFLPTGPIAGVDWLGVECYTLATETAAQNQARVEAALALLDPGTVIMLVGLSYTSNTNHTQDADQLALSQVVPATIAASDARVQMVLMFSDGRPTGTQDHEEWRPTHQAIYDTITGTPAILP